jgi:alkanesulfonate monooxygenase SsuD/methylene tetrahydromethanopterin reductase-like flavin-dependent oxidoreductase (luciferase family)
MKFGLMYEIQIPKPHYPGIERDTHKQVLAQVILAEELGFSHFWTVEHHFLTEFSHCPAPEVLYGAVSQRTDTIRIGHAVALLPPQYNHPIRVAERAAVLDILSDGRAELGTGRSTTLIEMNGFGINPEDTKARKSCAAASHATMKGWSGPSRWGNLAISTSPPWAWSTAARAIRRPARRLGKQACGS